MHCLLCLRFANDILMYQKRRKSLQCISGLQRHLVMAGSIPNTSKMAAVISATQLPAIIRSNESHMINTLRQTESNKWFPCMACLGQKFRCGARISLRHGINYILRVAGPL